MVSVRLLNGIRIRIPLLYIEVNNVYKSMPSFNHPVLIYPIFFDVLFYIFPYPLRSYLFFCSIRLLGLLVLSVLFVFLVVPVPIAPFLAWFFSLVLANYLSHFW